MVLLVLAGVQLATDHTNLTGPTIIAVMVSISVLLSFSQEYRSSKAAEKLKAMVRNTATVTRRASDEHSERIDVPVGELVAGDIVQLAAGDMVPADCASSGAKDLFMNQAMLTGESLPVEKSAPLPVPGVDTSPWVLPTPAGLSSVCFMGTNVVSGTAPGPCRRRHGLAQLLRLGMASAPGRRRPETSFDRGVKSVSFLLIRFMRVMVPVGIRHRSGLTNGLEAAPSSSRSPSRSA